MFMGDTVDLQDFCSNMNDFELSGTQNHQLGQK